MKSRLLWFYVFAFAFCLPVALFAQDTASITGTVTDPTGAAIPGAQVTLTSAGAWHQARCHQQRQRRLPLRRIADRVL